MHCRVRYSISGGISLSLVFLLNPFLTAVLPSQKQVHLPGAKAGGILVSGLVTRFRDPFSCGV